MKMPNQNHPARHHPHGLEQRISLLIERPDGLGYILLYMLLLCSFIATIGLVGAGFVAHDPLYLLLGLGSLLLFFYCTHIGGELLSRLSPSNE